jgi:pyridoxal phosphate enzyme (YggS family)
MPVNALTIAENVAAVRDRLARAAARAGRRADEVTLVAISKTFPAAAIRAAWDVGVRHFGENRVQEWESKHSELTDLEATWHLVGHLQSNKAKRAAGLFHCVDSVDSIDLARRLDAALGAADVAPAFRRASAPDAGQRRLRVLLEVRLAPEETKSGVEPSELEALARGVLLLPRLELAGLMCIPPPADEPEQMRPYFRRLRELRDTLRSTVVLPANTDPILRVLSMGMSYDFEVAIEEGATEVRLGTAIFGARG